MDKILGLLIRKNRIEKNYSQEGLCQGICVVSYLSKIENGQVEPSEDIIAALFKALGMRYERDEEYLEKIRERIQKYFEHYFLHNLSKEEEAGLVTELESEYERISQSRLYLSAELFRWYRSNYEDKQIENRLTALKDYMEPPQKALFHLGKSFLSVKEGEEEAHLMKSFSYLPSSMTAFFLANHYMVVGQYHKSIVYSQKTFDLAVSEGCLYYMVEGSVLLGFCYSNERQIELMLEHFNRAKALAKGVYSNIEGNVDYNIGATLAECKQYKEAYSYLKNAFLCVDQGKRIPTLHYHKLSLVCAQLGRREEALHYIHAARENFDEKEPAVYKQLITSIDMRLSSDYLEKEEYLQLIESIYETLKVEYPFGFQRFYGDFLIEAYVAKRKYKEALRVSLEMQKSLFK